LFGNGKPGEHYVKPKETLTTASGKPVGDNQNSITAGRRGPLLLAEDFHLYEKNVHFNRERIPPRSVHEKGAGAFGTFTVTKDITKYTKAKVFERPGKKTEIFARWSPVAGEHGSADSVRDPRGFAVKFYTEEGNWDLTGNNTPIFFIRDPLKFPDLIHSQKRDGRGLRSWTMRWDFWGHSPEATHQVLWLMGDRGLPKSYRHMNGYGSHTFSLINDKNERTWCKFHMKSEQGNESLTDEEGIALSGENPDLFNEDMFMNIQNGNGPKWKMFIQVMTDKEADELDFDPFDLTKVWPHKEFPLHEVGELHFDRNPSNYFQDVEQASFAPANVVPGIGYSPDRVLQARLFAYKDAAVYRLGINHEQLPVNKPRCPVFNYHADGAMQSESNGLGPTYEPNSFGGPVEDPKYMDPPVPYQLSGEGKRYNHRADSDDFSQATALWHIMQPDEQERVITNITNTMTKGKGAGCKSEPVPKRIQQLNLYNFYRVDKSLGERLAKSLGLDLQETIHKAEKELRKEVPALVNA
jgi:catalase